MSKAIVSVGGKTPSNYSLQLLDLTGNEVRHLLDGLKKDRTTKKIRKALLTAFTSATINDFK